MTNERTSTGEYAEHEDRYPRPIEVDALIGDQAKAERELGWRPPVRAPELVELMVDAEVQLLEDEVSGRRVRVDA